CTLYPILTAESPVGLTHRLPKQPEETVTLAEARQFQEAAWRVHREINGAAEPIAVATRACLFLDDRFIAEQTRFPGSGHQGQQKPEPAIAASGPWEKWPHMFGSVLYDPQAKLYKMWYVDLPVWKERGGVFYAESTDAKVWKKPDLGLIELQGSKANNCLFLNAELPNVFLDPNATDSEARFKMLVWRGNFTFKERTIYGLIEYSSG